MAYQKVVISETITGRAGRKKTWLAVLKIGLSLGVLGVILYLVDFAELVTVISNLNPWYLVAVIALVYVDRALMAYKWRRLLEIIGAQVPFLLLFRTYIVTLVSQMILPSTIGTDLFRVYDLGRYKVDAKAVIASIVMERLVGFVAILLLVSVSLLLAFFLAWDSLIGLNILLWIVGTGAIITVGLIGAIHPNSRAAIRRSSEKLKRYPYVGKLHQIYSMFCDYRNHRRTIGIVFGWSLIVQMLPIFGNFLTVKALHVEVSIVDLVIILPLIQLAGRLPISLDGIGVKEGMYVGLFGLVGVSVSEALLMSAAGRLLPLVAASPWVVHYFLKKGHPELSNHRAAL